MGHNTTCLPNSGWLLWSSSSQILDTQLGKLRPFDLFLKGPVLHQIGEIIFGFCSSMDSNMHYCWYSDVFIWIGGGQSDDCQTNEPTSPRNHMLKCTKLTSWLAFLQAYSAPGMVGLSIAVQKLISIAMAERWTLYPRIQTQEGRVELKTFLWSDISWSIHLLRTSPACQILERV